MFSKTVIRLVKIVVIVVLLGMSVTSVINSNFSQQADPIASNTSLVYNIRRDDFDYKWKGGSLTLTIRGKEVDLYINPELIKSNEGMFVDNDNLVINNNCEVIRLTIDLALAQINNDLTSIQFDDEYKPMDIIKEFECI